jgi:tetratricopeptide (TPR) repeat protein
MSSWWKSWRRKRRQAREKLGEHYLALAETSHSLGKNEEAAAHYRNALAYNGNLGRAYNGLATLRLPGDDYLTWLDRLYALDTPENVVEIGVAYGHSLSRVKPPTIAIGIDPNPRLEHRGTAETHIFQETSDAFFARGGPEAVLKGRPLGIGFIDGLHLYEQALKDFINLEKYCGPRSMILFHDTLPLNEPTQRRSPTTPFQTGDVWKTVLCLKSYRPDLDIFTIATIPSGLTVVTGLDPQSRLLWRSFDEAVEKFIDLPYKEIEHRWRVELNVVPNDWNLVEARLKARGRK